MTRTEITAASIPTGVFVGTFLFRWVTLDFDNDYFMHVAWAAEMLRGGRPVRDFVEPGFVLQTFLTFAGFRLGGYQLFWEGVLACALIAAGALFVYLTCRRLGSPRWLTLLVVLLAVASYPRLYAYPKAFVYPVAIWAIAIHAGRPTRRSLLLLSGITALAFLFRHDHGVWIGAAATLSLVTLHYRQPGTAARAIAVYGVASALFVTPWLAWVAVSGHAAQYVGFLTGQSQGLVTNRILPDRTFAIDSSVPLVTLAPIEYPRVRIRWAPGTSPDDRRQRERLYALEGLPDTDEYRLLNVTTTNVRALVGDPVVEDTSGIDRSTLRVPSGLFPWVYLRLQQYLPLVRVRILAGAVRPSNAQAWLAYATFVLPWIVLGAVLVAAARRQTATDPMLAALIVPAAVLSIVTYQALVRGSPDSRLGDVASMTALLAAWLFRHVWRVGGWPGAIVKPAAVLLLVVTVGSAISYGQALPRLAAARVDGPTNLGRRVRAVGERYAATPLEVFAPPGSNGLPGLARWLNECTAPHDRVSVIGFEPQVFVVAERGFAGGMAFYYLGWASSDRDQMDTLERWSRQQVPIVLAMESEWSGFSRDYPRIRTWIDRRYDVERESGFGGNKVVTVLRDRSRSPVATHHATGLPCFR